MKIQNTSNKNPTTGEKYSVLNKKWFKSIVVKSKRIIENVNIRYIKWKIKHVCEKKERIFSCFTKFNENGKSCNANWISCTFLWWIIRSRRRNFLLLKWLKIFQSYIVARSFAQIACSLVRCIFSWCSMLTSSANGRVLPVLPFEFLCLCPPSNMQVCVCSLLPLCVHTSRDMVWTKATTTQWFVCVWLILLSSTAMLWHKSKRDSSLYNGTIITCRLFRDDKTQLN